MDIVDALLEVKHGHGAFGEPESYEPSSLQIDAANEIMALRRRVVELETAIWHIGGIDVQVH